MVYEKLKSYQLYVLYKTKPSLEMSFFVTEENTNVALILAQNRRQNEAYSCATKP